MLPNVPLNTHNLDVLAAALALLAGLFAYQSVLGQPYGILRRILYAIPQAAAATALVLIMNDLAHGLFERIAHDVLNASVPIATLSIGVFAFAFCVYFIYSRVGLQTLEDATEAIRGNLPAQRMRELQIAREASIYTSYVIYRLLTSRRFWLVLEGLLLELFRFVQTAVFWFLMVQIVLKLAGLPRVDTTYLAVGVSLVSVVSGALTLAYVASAAQRSKRAQITSQVSLGLLAPLGCSFRIAEVFILVSIIVLYGWLSGILLLLALSFMRAVAMAGLVVAKWLPEKGITYVSLILALSSGAIFLYTTIIAS